MCDGGSSDSGWAARSVCFTFIKPILRRSSLFIPFKDATSGPETYGAGRHLDFDAARDRTADGKWILDLNRAYNPWCMYSEEYTCPFVPRENCLAMPIRAGEENYPLN